MTYLPPTDHKKRCPECGQTVDWQWSVEGRLKISGYGTESAKAWFNGVAFDLNALKVPGTLEFFDAFKNGRVQREED